MKQRTKSLLTVVLTLLSAVALQAQAPSSRKVPFNNVTTTMTCAPDPSPCQRNVILRVFDAATAGTQVGVDEPQTVSVLDPDGTGGSISFVLGSTRPMGVDPGDFQAGSSRFLDVLAAATLTTVLPGRMELTAVAFAVNPGPQGPQGIEGPQGIQGAMGAQGPPGVVQTVSAGDASIAVGGTAADRLVSIAPNGVTNAHVANGALSSAKISGNAATLGSNNNFTGIGSFAAGLGVGNVASFSIAAAPAGATESGTLVTITTTAPHSFNIGDLVTISGVAVSGYNGTFYVAGPGLSATTFTYVAPTAGLAASGGGTTASGALLSVSDSPNNAASPLLSITNTANGMAALTLVSGGDIPWSIGTDNPPDQPTFRGLFFSSGRLFSPVTRMAITTGGRVGIGTTIPSKLLDVAGDGNFNGSLSAGSGSFTGSLSAGSFTGSGAGLTSLNASSLSSGAVPSAQIGGVYTNGVTFSNAANSFTGSGAGLTALNATSLASGSVADVRLSSNVPLLSNASNAFTGSLSIGSGVQGTGIGSGNGVRGTGGPTNGIGVVGNGSGFGFGVTGTGGPTNGTGVRGDGSGVGSGVFGQGGGSGGVGVRGNAGGNADGVQGQGSGVGSGVSGTGGPTNGIGVVGNGSGFGFGVTGTGGPTNGTGVRGDGSGAGSGVFGQGGGINGTGVQGQAGGSGGTGVVGNGAGTGDGVRGNGGPTNGIGVNGNGSGSGSGVSGTGGPTNGKGVEGFGGTTDGTGVVGTGVGIGSGVQGNGGTGGIGVRGLGGSAGGTGVVGSGGGNGAGVVGQGNGAGTGVSGFGGPTNGIGVFGQGGGTGRAGQFNGDVNVTGTLTKGGGMFHIDHPLDPANKYLNHSFVESPDMMNIYNGVARLDAAGEAVVELPAWFEALNRDFRYQLTAIGAPEPNLYIAEEVANNRFRIAGGRAGMKVSWQVTGIRQDPWANAHRIAVEQDKPEAERGSYLHPELYGQPEEKAMEWALKPNLMRRLKEEASKP